MAEHHRDRAGIFIFEGVEVLDFCGPMEVLYTSKEFDIITTAPDPEPIRAASGMAVTPDCGMDDCPPLDLLIVPGGPGTRALERDERVLNWLRRQAQEVTLIATVCTGSVLLGAAGLLRGLRATTHWRALSELDRFEEVTVDRRSRIVDEDHIVTSAGISAGTDMTLHILESRYGRDALQRALDSMEYDAYPDAVPAYRRKRFVWKTNGV